MKSRLFLLILTVLVNANKPALESYITIFTQNGKFVGENALYFENSWDFQVLSDTHSLQIGPCALFWINMRQLSGDYSPEKDHRSGAFIGYMTVKLEILCWAF